MVETQVQIPDELYERAKHLAAENEWTFAEVVRRGLEYITQANPPARVPGAAWQLPPGQHLGSFLAPAEQWTELSHEG